MLAVSKGESGVRHIGVNAQLLTLDGNYRSAGIHSYIYNLLHHLPEADPTFFYTVFVGDRRCAGLPRIERRLTRLPTYRPAVRIVWEQLAQPWAMRRAGVDLIHGPAFVGPQAGGCPFVVTVHDLSFLLYPQGFRALNRFYLRTFTRLSVRRACRVIAVSERTRQDLIRCYDLSPAKIDVVYNGVDAGFRPLSNDRVSAFRVARSLPERFILFVGTLEPRKNVVRLIEAYAHLAPGRPPLLIVGGKGWLYDEIFARVEARNLGSEVRFVGHVPGEELPLWYNAADLFIYPSLYEGFGLPPLEAMACGTPVVASTASSLPEVVGQAGLLVDPTDVEALAVAMRRLLADREQREEMRAAGLARVQCFSWQTTASRTVDSYRQALNSGGGKGVV
jgi:glycosyltransferase involved in cell wall biosynthesis